LLLCHGYGYCAQSWQVGSIPTKKAKGNQVAEYRRLDVDTTSSCCCISVKDAETGTVVRKMPNDRSNYSKIGLQVSILP